MKHLIIIIGSLLAGVTFMSFIIKKNKDELKLSKGFHEKYSLVESGKIVIGSDTSKTLEFYISKTEITNQEYREFVKGLATSEFSSLSKTAIVDTMNWDKELKSSAMTQYYYSHPAYNNYPVVNVSYEAATLYCKWLTQKTNKTLTNGLVVEYRLPNRQEWVKAAEGKLNRIEYAWGGPYLENLKGCKMANFKNLGASNIHFDQVENKYYIIETSTSNKKSSGKLNDNKDITAPVNSYWPNSIVLFNMNGNVAEMLLEKGTAAGGSWASTGYDIRNESIMTYNNSSPMVGFRPIATIINESPKSSAK